MVPGAALVNPGRAEWLEIVYRRVCCWNHRLYQVPAVSSGIVLISDGGSFEEVSEHLTSHGVDRHRAIVEQTGVNGVAVTTVRRCGC